MSLLYRGTPYFKGNVFVDNKGAKLTFDKNTKKGKIFITEKGIKVGLTESQVSKLKVLNEYENKTKVIGLNIKFDGFDEDLTILENSFKNINIEIDNDTNTAIGYVCFDIKNVKLGNLTLGFLRNRQHSGKLEIMLEDLSSDIINITWLSGIERIHEFIYLFMIEGSKV